MHSLKIFDDLDYLSVKNQTTSFPKHFHSTFCISLIFSGVEKIDFGNYDLYSEPGSISITNPFEIHSNPLVHKDVSTSFDTVYISGELMKYYTQENIIFNQRKIQDVQVSSKFLALKKSIETGDQQHIHSSLKQFIELIKPYSNFKNENYASLNFAEFENLEEYIEQNIFEKFDLSTLAQLTNSNKYGFVKKFKLFTGMSPMNYIIMRKIFLSKSSIAPNTNLSELAYKYNFTDLAHFSKTFKRYIGVPPKTYQDRMQNKH